MRGHLRPHPWVHLRFTLVAVRLAIKEPRRAFEAEMHVWVSIVFTSAHFIDAHRYINGVPASPFVQLGLWQSLAMEGRRAMAEPGHARQTY